MFRLVGLYEVVDAAAEVCLEMLRACFKVGSFGIDDFFPFEISTSLLSKIWLSREMPMFFSETRNWELILFTLLSRFISFITARASCRLTTGIIMEPSGLPFFVI
jgi:hypothetical protein